MLLRLIAYALLLPIFALGREFYDRESAVRFFGLILSSYAAGAVMVASLRRSTWRDRRRRVEP